MDEDVREEGKVGILCCRKYNIVDSADKEGVEGGVVGVDATVVVLEVDVTVRPGIDAVILGEFVEGVAHGVAGVENDEEGEVSGEEDEGGGEERVFFEDEIEDFGFGGGGEFLGFGGGFGFLGFGGV